MPNKAEMNSRERKRESSKLKSSKNVYSKKHVRSIINGNGSNAKGKLCNKK